MNNRINFTTNQENFCNDYMDIIRAFYPHVILDENGENVNLDLERISNNAFVVKITFSQNVSKTYEKTINLEQFSSQIEEKSYIKRFSKVFLYELLCEKLCTKLPYGSLTGIRPTKLYHDLLSKGVDARSYFIDRLHVSENKTNLISTIVKNQTGIYNHESNEVDVFVNIPICVSRCSYCSFISAQLDKVKKLVCPYTDQLVGEIENTKDIIKAKGFVVRSVYIGGGTPTSLDDVNFKRVVDAANFNVSEYTVEAGRPDTITKTKLDIMKEAGVTRISINPQTFNQKTLDLIGRKHTVEDIYSVYKLARTYPFEINMDLIAMLPGEGFDEFKKSVDAAIALDPDNITVHTLALKRGSVLHENNYDNADEFLPAKLIDYSMNAIENSGYEPYYMYKQKHMSGNLENVGYCKPGKACVYNVDIMEETNSIIANGAGGISKLLDNKMNRIERLANPKGLEVYLERKEQIIVDKNKFFNYI